MNAFRLFTLLLVVCSMVLAASAELAELATDDLVCSNFFTNRNEDKCAACCISKGFDRQLSIASSSIDGTAGGSCICAKTDASVYEAVTAAAAAEVSTEATPEQQ